MSCGLVEHVRVFDYSLNFRCKHGKPTRGALGISLLA
jgi:hypothetical protein